MQKGTRDVRVIVGVIIFFCGLSIIMTFPVVRDMFRGCVVAQFHDDLINVWTLMWDIHSILRHGFNLRQLFDANVFYPYRFSLAFSEHQIFSAVLGLPVYLLTKSAVVMYGVLTILPFALSGITMFILARYLTGNYLAGIVAGIIYAFIPYKMWCIHQLQNLMTMWIPLTLLYLHKFYQDMKYRYMVYAGIFFALTALSNGYYMMYFSVFVMLFVVFYGVYYRVTFTKKHLIAVSLMVLTAFSIIFPFYYPYLVLQHLYGMSRKLSEVQWYAATLKSYYSTFSWYRHLKFLHFFGDRPLFVGFSPIILVGYLVFKLGRKLFGSVILSFYSVLTVLAIVLSFGPYVRVFGVKMPSLYFLFYKYFPGFSGLREPTRFGVFVALGVGIIAGYGVANLVKVVKWRKVLWLIPIVVIFEYACFPLSMVRVPYYKGNLGVISWLSAQSSDFAIFEVPYSINEMVFYMYYSTYHWKRIVSSFNGFLPPIQQILGVSDWKRKLAILRSIDVRYVVIYKMWYPKRAIRKLVRMSGNSLKKVYEDDKSVVYEIVDRDRSFVPYGTKLSRYKFSVYIPSRLPPGRKTVLILQLLGDKPVVFLDEKRVWLVWFDGIGRELRKELVKMDVQRLAFLESGKSIVGTFEIPDLPVGKYKIRVLSMDGRLLGSAVVNIMHNVRYWSCQPLPEDGYKVKFVKVNIPNVVQRSDLIKVMVSFRNTSRYDWITYDTNRWQRLSYITAVSIPTLYNIHLSYHWRILDSDRYAVFDGNRAVLPCVVRSGEVVEVPLMIKVPDKEGKYELEVTLVQEGVSWFEQKGAKMFKKVVRVR